MVVFEGVQRHPLTLTRRKDGLSTGELDSLSKNPKTLSKGTKHMKSLRNGMLIAAVAAGSLLTAEQNAQAGVTLYDETYRSFADSPFAPASGSGNFWLEDFEEGLNIPGVTIDTGYLRNPSSMTDSVDGDDGTIDGWGQNGHSWMVPAAKEGASTVLITFDSQALGGLPTFAGLVWTDGNPNAVVTLEALDAGGNVMGQLVTNDLNDFGHNGQAAADRFLGASFGQGISALRLSASMGGIEFDHLQMGMEAAVIPLPPAIALGGMGLGLIAARRRKLKSGC